MVSISVSNLNKKALFQSKSEEVKCWRFLFFEAADERSLDTKDEKSPESSILCIFDVFPN